MLCVFLRGVGIVGATPSQDEMVDPQASGSSGHDSRYEKERDLDVRGAESK